MPYIQYVPILHNVPLPLQSPVPCFFRLGERSSRGDEVVVVHDLGADEVLDEVGVDDAGGFLRGHAGADGPGV